jgi:hypothetical protein
LRLPEAVIADAVESGREAEDACEACGGLLRPGRDDAPLQPRPGALDAIADLVRAGHEALAA